VKRPLIVFSYYPFYINTILLYKTSEVVSQNKKILLKEGCHLGEGSFPAVVNQGGLLLNLVILEGRGEFLYLSDDVVDGVMADVPQGDVNGDPSLGW